VIFWDQKFFKTKVGLNIEPGTTLSLNLVGQISAEEQEMVQMIEGPVDTVVAVTVL
jgi:hypothetical protein